MSRKVAHPSKRKQKSRRRPVVILGTLLILILAVGVMAQWNMVPRVSKPLALSPDSLSTGSLPLIAHQRGTSMQATAS